MSVETELPPTPAQPLPDNANPELDETASRIGNKCVTLIFNPVSGQGDPEERKRAVSDALAEHGYGCQELITTKEKGARAFAKEALESGVDLLAVSGRRWKPSWKRCRPLSERACRWRFFQREPVICCR